MRIQHHQFNREKFKEAIWAIVEHCPPSELGNVKLHKALYFADMLTFLDEGRPLTGVEYLKQKFGPTARYLSAAITELADEGRLCVNEVDYYGFVKKEYRTSGESRRGILTDDEHELLIDIADFVRGRSAKEVSELSHNEAWETAELGEVLPYTSALRLIPVEISDSDRTWAMETAKTYAAEPWPSKPL